MTPQQLSRLSALLDDALDLDAAAREAWLQRLGADDAALAAQVRELLLRHATTGQASPLDASPVQALMSDGDGTGGALGAGDRVGPYRLLRELGAGGMGEVWLAERADGAFQRQVALKLPTLGLRRSVLVQRFARERDILAALEHPHIARLYDAGADADGQPYLAMEFVEGQPIDVFCRERALDTSARVALLVQVARAVAYAHSRLVIHRDLKPGNILVTGDGQVRLLDFGIAKLVAPETNAATGTELTRLGGGAMTLSYAAPEQVAEQPPGTVTDVWALGVVLYELLAGQRPFVGLRHEVETAILQRDPQPPAGVPTDLTAVLFKALQKDPLRRYPTADALADDLDRWLAGEAVMAPGAGRGYRLRKFAARYRLAIGASLGVFAVLLLASIVSFRQAQRAEDQAQAAIAVRDFLQGLFLANRSDQDDPLKARQRTAEQLLADATARIQRDLDHAPEARLFLLGTLAEMHRQMDELDLALALNHQRTELALQLHGAGSAAHLKAQLAVADTLAHDGERIALLRDIERHMAADAGIDAGLRVELLLAMATHHATHAEFDQCRPRIERALALLGEERGGRMARARLIEARCLGMRDATAAERALRAGLAMAISSPDPIPREVHVALLRDLAALAADRGEVAQSEALFAAAYERAAPNLGPLGLEWLRTLQRHADTLTERGEIEQALDRLRRARVALGERASSRAWAMARSSLAVTESWALLETGQASDALELAENGLRIRSQAGVEELGALHLMVARASTMLCRFDRSEQALARIEAILDASPDKYRTRLARDWVAETARLAKLQGHAELGLETWRAWRRRAALDAEPRPGSPSEQLLLGEIELQAGHADSAARRAGQALQTLQSSAQATSRHAARAWSLRGRARLALPAERAGAFEDLRRALERWAASGGGLTWPTGVEVRLAATDAVRGDPRSLAERASALQDLSQLPRCALAGPPIAAASQRPIAVSAAGRADGDRQSPGHRRMGAARAAVSPAAP
ncbi:MAG: protein kinase [Rubrivivax sp.]